MPELFIIAGCNGAGKTTAAKELLPGVFHTAIFINADMIVAKLNPLHPEKAAMSAGRFMLKEIQQRLSEKQTFALETTLATRIYFNIIEQAKLLGYDVILYYFWLPSANMAKERVKLRVSKGGHNIPEDVIERRYNLGIKYFYEYLKIVNFWFFYDNSSNPSHIIAKGEMPDVVLIYNFDLWEQLRLK